MTSDLFDTHCHLDDSKFDEDRDLVIQRMIDQGMAGCVCVGSDLSSSQRCIALAEQYPFVYATAGVHPHEAKDAPNDYLESLRKMLEHPKVLALGEIGLDYHYDFSPRSIQAEVFIAQIHLAFECQKPLIIHVREAHGDVLRILREHKKQLTGGIIHCYSGSAESAAEYLSLGFMISFSGSLTFKNAVNLKAAAQSIPLDRLLIETDSPYMAPVPHRGKRNEPLHVAHVCECLAEIKGLDVQDVARQTFENAKQVYRTRF